MTSSHGHSDLPIDKRDFDANRPLLQDNEAEGCTGHLTPYPRSLPGSRLSADSERSRGDDGLLNDVVEGIVERDRQKIHREVVRVVSFAWGVVTW
jgi:hypothetical protein